MYSHKTNKITNGEITLEVLPRAGLLSLVNSLGRNWYTTDIIFGDHYYVIRHPLKRMLSCHANHNVEMTFKQYLLNFPPERIQEGVPGLRLEYIVNDLKEIGINAEIKHCNKGKKHITPCLTSRIMLRSLCNREYVLGEYD